MISRKRRNIRLFAAITLAAFLCQFSSAAFAASAYPVLGHGEGSYSLYVGSSEYTWAKGNYSVSIGYKNNAAGDYSAVVGYNNTANGYMSSAFGVDNIALDYSSAVGKQNQANGSGSSAFGYSNLASGAASSAFGYSNNASGMDSSAFGYSNLASGILSSAFGYHNVALGGQSSAFGFINTASGRNSVAVGYENTASGENSISLGYYNTASAGNSVSVGYYNTASGTDSLAIGNNNTASRKSSTSVGIYNNVSGLASSAFGGWNSVSGNYSSAFGYYNCASGKQSVAIGAWSKATAENSVAIGTNALAENANSVAIGSYSKDRAPAGGAYGVFSVGSQGKERQVINVAAGTSNTDAVNLKQLKDAVAGIAQKGTTLADYGIEDAYTKTAADAKFAGKAATLAGYGINDAYTKAETEAKLGQKASAAALAEAQERIAIDEGLIDFTAQNVVANAAYIAEIITGDVMNSGITAAKVQKYDAYEAQKADRAATLSGYGIADAYTKTELYTRSETEEKIADAVSGISPSSKYAADSGAAEINNTKTLTVAGGTNIVTELTETGGNAKIAVKLKDDIAVGSITTTGSAAVGGTLSAGGNLTVAGTSDFTGAATFHSGANMGGQKITNLAAGSANTDAANYGQLIGSFVQDTATGAVKAVTNAGTEMSVAQLQDAAISEGRITTGSDGTKYLTLTKKDRYTGVTTDLAGIDLTGITSTITIGGTTAPLTNGDNIEFKPIYESDGTTVKEIAVGLQKDITLKSIKLNTGGEHIWLDEDGVSISDKETGSANFSGLNSTALYTGKSEISADGDVISSEIYSGLSQDTLMVGKKNYITSDGINANELKITNVADGEIAAGSKDAANAGQLYSEQLARIAGDTLSASGNYYASGVSTISAIGSLDTQVKLNENAILANSNSITFLQTSKADKATTLAGYGITNAYTKTEANDKFAQKATTLAGYGITDAYTTAAADAKFAQKAATLAGYGITDAYTKQEIDNALVKKADVSQVAELAEKTAASERKITVLENTAEEHTEKINNLTTDMTQAKSDIAALETAAAGKADRAYVDDRFDTIKAQTTAKDGFYVKRAKTVAENLEALDLAINSQEQPSAASAFDIEDVNATATGAGASALGKNAKADGEKSVAIGYGAKASGANSIAIGTGHIVTGNNSGAFGDPNVISGNNSYAIGNNNTIEGDNNFVLGSNVKMGANVKNSVAFGSVDGKTLEITESNTVAVGGRTISGLADGINLTDAVTVGQVDRAFVNVQNQLSSVSTEVREVGAISAALAGLHYAEPSGEEGDKFVGAVAYGGYRGESAGAIGVAYKPNPNFMLSASTSVGNDQNAYNAGMSLKFGKGETAVTRASLQKQVKFVNEENQALKAENARQDAENAALKDRVGKLESEIEELKKLIKK